MIKGLMAKIMLILRSFLQLVLLHYQASRHGRSLIARQNNLGFIRKGDILLFSVMQNESHRIPYFLDYYRNLGVGHFIFVDNKSSDDLASIVSDSKDVSVFYTEESYKDSNFGMHWANYLLRRYGTGHWCITCDPDEFLVFPKIETRNIRDLTDYLASRRQLSLFTPMIDMYGRGDIDSAACDKGQNPLEVCPYFDAHGYVKKYQVDYRNPWCQGGVRRRVFYSEAPQSAPAINKYVLINWKKHFAYVQSMHMAVPRRLNEVVGPEYTSGAVLHFKFISALKDKVEHEMTNRQHYNNSAEYKKYGQHIDGHIELYDERISVPYQSWEDLTRLGLMNRGEW